MPTVHIETIPLTEEKRERLAEKVYNTVKSKVGDRVIDVYISEYKLFRRKGAALPEPTALVEFVAALVLPKDDMAELTKALHDTICEAMEQPVHVTFSYLRRDQDHLGVDGELLSDLYKRLAQSK